MQRYQITYNCSPSTRLMIRHSIRCRFRIMTLTHYIAKELSDKTSYRVNLIHLTPPHPNVNVKTIVSQLFQVGKL